MKRMAFLLLLPLLGCQPPARGIEVTRVAKVLVEEGTTKLMGSARLPQGSTEVWLAGARVQVVDATDRPLPEVPETRTDRAGAFMLSGVPVGVSMRVKISYQAEGRTLALYKYLRPSESLTCAHVDLATTVVADKLVSGNPLARPDPGLEGADVLDFADPDKLLAVEAGVRETLREKAPEVELAPEERNTSELFDQVVAQAPQLAEEYQEAFERPDCSLGVRIMAIGANRAPIPGVRDRKVCGVLRIRAEGLPSDTVRVEYHLNGELAATGTRDGAATINTWDYPNGPYTLETLAIRRAPEVINRTYMLIDNTLEAYCPLP